MITIEVRDDKHLQELVESTKEDGNLVLDFYKDNCRPCSMVAQMLDNVDAPDVVVAKVKLENMPEAFAEFGVMSTPTLVRVDKGEVINKHIGFLVEDQFKAFSKKEEV